MAAVQSQPAPSPGLFYKQVPETSYELEWAELATLDLSRFDEPGGKEALAKQLQAAIQTIGFFYIVNFGLSQEEVDRQFAIGREVFALPTEEKLTYRADLENGGYNGYKPLGLREVQPGVVDNTEIYNIPKFLPRYARPHPAVIVQHQAEIERVARHIHDHIVGRLLALFELVLELPEGALARHHRYDAASDCHLRYMKYHRRSAADNERLGNVWVRGHTDFGSLTLLFRQPVAALQVRAPDGSWRWVKPFDGSITVNIADALQFLTNGYLKSSIHRVVAPPPDQQNVDRLGLLYFVRPEDDLPLQPVQSAVLERLGFRPDPADAGAEPITAGEWVKARVKTNISRKGETIRQAEQEVLKGHKAKYYD